MRVFNSCKHRTRNSDKFPCSDLESGNIYEFRIETWVLTRKFPCYYRVFPYCFQPGKSMLFPTISGLLLETRNSGGNPSPNIVMKTRVLENQLSQLSQPFRTGKGCRMFVKKNNRPRRCTHLKKTG